MSQQDLSNASGVSKVFLGTVERNEKSVGLEIIAKLAKGLGVRPEELLHLDQRDVEKDPSAQLGQVVAALARSSSQARLAKFEKIARAFFEPEPHEPARQPRKAK